MKIYLFKDLNYYIGSTPSEWILDNSVVIDVDNYEGGLLQFYETENGIEYKETQEVEHEL